MPDISKHLGESKTRSHFFDDNENVDMNRFLEKYKNKLNHPFMLGYYIHLYTDYLWEKYFLSDIVQNNAIKLLNGETVPQNKETYKKLIYSDYTNLNIILLDEYQLDLSLFYNEAIVPDIEMDEIPVDRLYKLLDYTGVIIANTKKEKAYTFSLENIKPFIETSSHLILAEILELVSNSDA